MKHLIQTIREHKAEAVVFLIVGLCIVGMFIVKAHEYQTCLDEGLSEAFCKSILYKN